MTRSKGPSRWDPFRPLDMLVSLWSSAAALPPVSSGAAVAYRTLFVTLRRLVVGRTLTVRLDNGDLTLTVTKFESRLDLRGVAVGQLNDVRITATDIWWERNTFDRAGLVLHNVHLRPGSPPVLVAAPVDLTVELSTAALDDLVRYAMPRLAGEVDADGIARLRLARRPGLGNLEVDIRLDDSTLTLKPRALVLRRRRWTLPARTPAYRVQLPELPHGLELTGVSFQPGMLHLTGSLPQWRMEMPRNRLDDILTQLGSVGRPLNLTRLGRRT